MTSTASTANNENTLTQNTFRTAKGNGRNTRSSIEELFGRGKRLPVFAFITIDSDVNKKNQNIK